MIDTRSYEVTVDGRPIELARKEFELLLALARRAGEVVTKRDLLSEVWQLAWGGSDRTVDVHLSWLRRKLGESAAAPRYLQSVRGVGVRLVAPPDPEAVTVRRRILLLVVGMTVLVVLAFAIPLIFLDPQRRRPARATTAAARSRASVSIPLRSGPTPRPSSPRS